MTHTLSPELYKAVKATYIPMNKVDKTFPIFSHVRVYTEEGMIFVTSINTTGETWEAVTEAAPAIVENDFDTCVPMRPFCDWLKVTAKYKGMLEFSFDPKTQNLAIRDGATRATFKCIDAQEFPAMKGTP